MVAIDPNSGTKEAESIIDWLESNMGGRVRSIFRQSRWRPIWFVDLEREGKIQELCVRGERSDMELVWPLNHEMRFQSVMHDLGVPVPKVYGWIDSPAAYVQDRVPGRPDFKDTPDDQRDEIVADYVRALAHLHTRPLEPFAAADIDRAARPEDSGLIGMARLEGIYRRAKNRPDPLMEFGLAWFARNAPKSRGREAAVVWDSGQLHHHNGKFVSIMDVELGHIGDPMMDLAGWRMRDSVIPFGNFAKIYDFYGSLVGEPVDLEAIQIHHFGFTLSNQLGFSHTLRHPPPNSDYMTNLQWCNETNLYVTEFLAEYLDLELPTVEMPAPTTTQTSGGHKHLVRSLRNIQASDEYLRYKVRIAFRLAGHLDRYNEIGDAIEEGDLDDLEEFFGHRPDNWLEGEAELERFILADKDKGEFDVPLVGLLHKRNIRAQMLNGPVGSAMARHLPIQSFRD